MGGDGFRQLWRSDGAFVRKLCGGVGGGFPLLVDLAGEAFDFLTPAFDLREAGSGGFAKGDHLCDGTAILPFQRLKESDALFHLREFPRLDVEVFGVVLDAGCEVFDLRDAAM